MMTCLPFLIQHVKYDDMHLKKKQFFYSYSNHFAFFTKILTFHFSSSTYHKRKVSFLSSIKLRKILALKKMLKILTYLFSCGICFAANETNLRSIPLESASHDILESSNESDHSELSLGFETFRRDLLDSVVEKSVPTSDQEMQDRLKDLQKYFHNADPNICISVYSYMLAIVDACSHCGNIFDTKTDIGRNFQPFYDFVQKRLQDSKNDAFNESKKSRKVDFDTSQPLFSDHDGFVFKTKKNWENEGEKMEKFDVKQESAESVESLGCIFAITEYVLECNEMQLGDPVNFNKITSYLPAAFGFWYDDFVFENKTTVKKTETSYFSQTVEESYDEVHASPEAAANVPLGKNILLIAPKDYEGASISNKKKPSQIPNQYEYKNIQYDLIGMVCEKEDDIVYCGSVNYTSVTKGNKTMGVFTYDNVDIT